MTYDWALLYNLYTVVLHVKGAACFITLASAIGAITAGVAYVLAAPLRNLDDGAKSISDITKKVSKWLAVVCVVAWGISTVIPGRQDMKVMVALAGVENAVKSDKARNLAGKSYRVIDEWLDRLEKGK